jgi:ankyrin repeat protein
MVELLLSKGADPNYIDKTGFKTIEYAILQGLYEICYILYPLLKEKDLRTPQ